MEKDQNILNLMIFLTEVRIRDAIHNEMKAPRTLIVVDRVFFKGVRTFYNQHKTIWTKFVTYSINIIIYKVVCICYLVRVFWESNNTFCRPEACLVSCGNFVVFLICGRKKWDNWYIIFLFVLVSCKLLIKIENLVCLIIFKL